MKIFLRYWLPLAIYVGLILGVSLWMRSPLSLKLTGWDKEIHFLEYALLALLAVRALGAAGKRPWWFIGAGAVILAMALATLDETLQGFNPSRSPDWRDWLADFTGSVAGVGCYLAWYFRKRKKADSAQEA